jgi:hypothetical protein
MAAMALWKFARRFDQTEGGGEMGPVGGSFRVIPVLYVVCRMDSGTVPVPEKVK